MSRKTAKKTTAKSMATAQPKSDTRAYAERPRTEMDFSTYEREVAAGVRAFALTGDTVTKAQVRETFPPTEIGIAELVFFIWDVTNNDTEATRRILPTSVAV
jgi:hypothetical protein